MLWIASGLPSALIAAAAYHKLRPRGLLTMLRVGVGALVLAAAALCAVPWEPYMLVPYTAFTVAALISVPVAPVLAARRYAKERMALIQALLDTSVIVSTGSSVPIYSYLLYDASTESKAAQALPFWISFGLVGAGFGILIIGVPRDEVAAEGDGGLSADLVRADFLRSTLCCCREEEREPVSTE